MGNQWSEVQRQPRAWLLQADRVKRAADLVGSRFQGEAHEWARAALSSQRDPTDVAAAKAQATAFELALPAYMLIGYAIEVVTKGLIVSRDTSVQTVNWLTRNHLSVELLQRANVTLEPWERVLVTRLYHAVRWSGRYPAPNPGDAAKLDESVAAARGVIFSDPRVVSTDHYRQACELFDRIRAELAAALTPLPLSDALRDSSRR